MNLFEQAYGAGVKRAEASFGTGVGKLVAPGKVKAQSPTSSTTAVKSPTTPGATPGSAPPKATVGTVGSSTTSSSVLTPSMFSGQGAGGTSPFAASELAKQTASQIAGQNFTNVHFGGTQAPRALGIDPRAGSTGAAAGAKLGALKIALSKGVVQRATAQRAAATGGPELPMEHPEYRQQLMLRMDAMGKNVRHQDLAERWHASVPTRAANTAMAGARLPPTPSASAPAAGWGDVTPVMKQPAAGWRPTPPVSWMNAAKLGQFNMGMTPDPATKPDRVPKADNGRRTVGTHFAESPGPQQAINSAFNALSIPKNTDVLNEAGQAEFGAPRG